MPPHAFYVTINDVEENGRLRPFEVFISSANMEHFAWVVALTRMILAMCRPNHQIYKRGLSAAQQSNFGSLLILLCHK